MKIPALIKTIQIVFFVSAIYLLIKIVLNGIMKKDNKAVTVGRMIRSFVKYLFVIVAIFLILGAWGVDTSTLLASAGILSLVVGLGAQSLIADVIAGVFIIFEGDYQVGDIVVIDGWRGTVEDVGIRSTKITDAGGNIKIITNSSISSIINQTKELSVAKCIMSIEYGESLERVEVVIKNNLDAIKNAIPSIVEGPFYKGVTSLSSSSVDLLFLAKCKEEDIYQVQRDLNRELKLIFDKNNINIPFPQVVVNQPSEFSEATKHEQNVAKKFVEEQKEASKNVQEEHK